jgi:hypothetical protein
MIDAPFVAVQDGQKPLGVKIAVVYIVASLRQDLHNAAMKCSLEAVLGRMCIDH